MTRWENESNESMYERCRQGNVCKWSEVEKEKKNTLKWFGHLERKKSEGFVLKVYMSKIEAPRRRGRLVVRGVNRGERLQQAGRECVNRERWRHFCHDHPIGGYFRRELGVKNFR